MTSSEAGCRAISAISFLPGRAAGEVLKLTETLNLWGGLNPDDGTIIHHSHPQLGESVSGKILVLPETRGSGTNAQIFAQALAHGNGPRAVVLNARDYVLCAGAAVASELYSITCPIVLVEQPAHYNSLESGMTVEVEADEHLATLTIR